MGATRKKAIYEVCVKFDVIIVEDDPYFFLQVGEYVPLSRRSESLQVSSDDEEADFINSLVPSFLKFDYQGRVIRLDTFSKTIAPGSRLGWFTCNPLFAERLERIAETSTQAPCGFGQVLITQLLVNEWKFSGFIRWLRGIRAQYTLRRNAMLDTISEIFVVEEDWAADGQFMPYTGSERVRIFVARQKKNNAKTWYGAGASADEKKGKILFSFVAPTAGMFVWLKVHLYNHPAYSPDTPAPKSPEESLEYQLWEDLALNKILLGPGWVFGSDPDSMLRQGLDDKSPMLVDIEDKARIASENGKYGHLRVSFSDASPEVLKEGMSRFARVMHKNFE